MPRRREIEFARRWQDMPKVVFSSTITTVDSGARLVTGDAVTEITRHEYTPVTAPVLVGGGTSFFTVLDNWVDLTLVETRVFPNDAVLTRYEVKR